jgi:hypothetical protein
MESTKKNMMNTDRTIDRPAFQYVEHEAMKGELDEYERRERKRTGADAVRIRYRSKYQLSEEKEELEIAGQIDADKDLNDLKVLLREGRMKEFYELANRYMRIKRSNPVVTKVKRNSDGGDVEIFEERL